MLKLLYKIVESDSDDFYGQNGYLQMKCLSNSYGEYFEEDIVLEIFIVNLHDWFERILRATNILIQNKYVAINDTESINGWIEMQVTNSLHISSVIADKADGIGDIVVHKLVIKELLWKENQINLEQFCKEILEQSKKYMNQLNDINMKNKIIDYINLLQQNIM